MIEMSSNERKMIATGLLTWFVVAIPAVLWQYEQHKLFTRSAAAVFAALIIFIAAFATNALEQCRGPFLRVPLIIIESLAAFVCCYLQPAGFLPVLLVIVAAQLGAFPPRYAVPAAALNAIVLGFIVRATGGPALMFTLAYFAFSIFAVFTMHVAHSEIEARRALTEANAELKVTTELLEISSRTSERLRIARDLHDLLGHHLTALSLNLEVASHLATGEAKEQVAKSQAIARTLLADVRDVVSRLRSDEPVDLGASLESLRDVIVAPSLHLDYPRELAVADANVAQIALRTVQEIVTNAVRHSGARNLWLALTTADHTLSIDARDDGSGVDDIRYGNGLVGLRERVEQVRGTFAVTSSRGRGFEVHVKLPIGAAA